jgi:putative tricarboxylic transport membrane protein
VDLLHGLTYGLAVSLQPANLFACFVGVFVGTLIGVLPGIGPVGTMSLLLPATFHLSPVGAIIMLAGIYYGAQYGGSTTSILVNIPGEASSIVTCLDGYQMARRGRAGPALGMAALGSFIGGTAAIVGLMLLAAPLADAALSFGPPEYFALMCVSLVVLTFLSQASMYKSLMMALLGLLLSFVGLDMFTSAPRFTFGVNDLTDGIGLIPLVMGLFGVAEILLNLEGAMTRDIYDTPLGELLPSAADWIAARWAVVRGTVLGFFLGLLPGGGAVLASFVAYAVEKRGRGTRSASARGSSRAWPRRRPRTTPPLRRRSFRCSRSACPRTSSWPCCSVACSSTACSRGRSSCSSVPISSGAWWCRCSWATRCSLPSTCR